MQLFCSSGQSSLSASLLLQQGGIFWKEFALLLLTANSSSQPEAVFCLIWDGLSQIAWYCRRALIGCLQVGKDAVVVEADAIKNMEGLFQSLSRLDMLDMLDRLKCDGDYLNRHMHEYSTKAAENMFVAAGDHLPSPRALDNIAWQTDILTPMRGNLSNGITQPFPLIVLASNCICFWAVHGKYHISFARNLFFLRQDISFLCTMCIVRRMRGLKAYLPPASSPDHLNIEAGESLLTFTHIKRLWKEILGYSSCSKWTERCHLWWDHDLGSLCATNYCHGQRSQAQLQEGTRLLCRRWGEQLWEARFPVLDCEMSLDHLQPLSPFLFFSPELLILVVSFVLKVLGRWYRWLQNRSCCSAIVVFWIGLKQQQQKKTP